MLLPPHMAGRVLSAMRPYSEVVCCVHMGQGRYGLARSDPYLSCASVFGEMAAPGGPHLAATRLLRELTSERVPVGMLVLGLPMRCEDVGGDDDFAAAGQGAADLAAAAAARADSERGALARALASAASSAGGGGRAVAAVPLCAYDGRVTLAAARHEQQTNAQWESVGALDGGACSTQQLGAGVHAAVALQSLLDEEMGGWPNTFG